MAKGRSTMMHTTNRLPWTALALLVAAALAVRLHAGEAAMTMDFNADLRIEGQPRPGQVTGTPRFVEGHAVVIGPQDRFTVPHAGALSAEAGTLEMRLRAVDWSGADQSFKFFFHARTQDDIIQLRKGPSGQLQFLIGRLPHPFCIETDAGDWNAGEWRTIKAVWSRDLAALYVDGQRRVEEPRPGHDLQAAETILLGGVIWNPAAGTSWLDVLRLSTTPDFSETAPTIGRGPAAPAIEPLENSIATADCNAVLLPSSQDRADKSRCAEAALDGLYATYFLSEKGEADPWVEVRWPAPVTVTGTRLAWVRELMPAGYTVSARIGEAWQTLAVQNDAEALTAFPPTLTSRLRLAFPTPAAGQIAIRDLQVAGQAANRSFLTPPRWAGAYLWRDADRDVRFRRRFRWSDGRGLAKAAFMISVDDSYRLYLNGEEIGAGGFPVISYDITARIRPGENVLAVHASDFGGNFGMLAELVLVDDHGGMERIGTDGQWECLLEPVEGWYRPGEAAGRWEAAAVSRSLPSYQENIAYTFEPPGTDGGFEVVGLDDWPRECTPGAQIEAVARVRLNRAVDADYGFRAIVGMKPASDSTDYTLAAADIMPSTPTSQWAAGQTYAVRLALSIPEWAPHGRLPLRLRALADVGEFPVRFAAEPHLAIRHANAAPALKSTPSTAEIRMVNHQTRVVINGEVMPPVVFALNAAFTTYRELGEQSAIRAGIYRFSPADCALFPPDGIDEEAHFRRVLPGLDQQIREVLRFYPNAYLLIPLDCRVNYANTHPDEATVLSDGRRIMHSFSSERWRDEAIRGGTRIIRHMLRSDYAGHIAGVVLTTGLGGETMIYGYGVNRAGKTPRDEIALGDVSNAATRGFRQALRERYHDDVEALRKAWKRPAVTFDDARVEPDELRRLEEACFRDPATGRMAMDYWEYHSDAVANAVAEIAAAFKTAGEGRILVGAWGFYTIGTYASFGTRMYGLHQVGPMSLDVVLQSPAIDFLATIQGYWGVRAGTPLVTQLPSASMRHHGKAFIEEYDIRTFFVDMNVVRDHYTTSQAETLNVMRRDFAETAVRGDLAWFCGFAQGFAGRRSVGWYAEDSLIHHLNRFADIGRRLTALTHAPGAEVALFLNNRDIASMDVMHAGGVVFNSQTKTVFYELKKVAASTDCYLLADFTPALIEPYKVLIFLNAASMDRATRRMIRATLEAQGKTALWLYAPGYVDENEGVSLESMTELTGLTLAKSPEARTGLAIAVDGDGLEHHEIQPCQDPFSPVPVTLGPVFSVADPEATILGRYVHSQAPALAWKQSGGMRSYYGALPLASATLLRAIFRTAGVHLYTEAPAWFLGSDRLLAFHAPAAIDTTVVLKQPRWVLDLYAQEIVARDSTTFDLKLTPGQSALYLLGDRDEIDRYLQDHE